MGPLLSMQLGGQILEGLFQVFNSYLNLLIRALPGSIEEEEEDLNGSSNKIVQMAQTDSQQIALLANASLLADELLPRAAMKLYPSNQDDLQRKPSGRQQRNPEQREWKRRLVSAVDRLRDIFCRQHALDLIFTDDGGSHLTADTYISMDENADQIEWFPSPIFQVVLVLSLLPFAYFYLSALPVKTYQSLYNSNVSLSFQSQLSEPQVYEDSLLVYTVLLCPFMATLN